LNESSRRFLERLLSTPGVSGYEQKVQEVVRAYAEPFADEIRTDVHGNVLAKVNPGAEPRLLLDGHCDQLGMLVSHVDDQGFLYFQTVGGWDPPQLVGQRVTVWTRGGPVHGVISRKAIHLLSEEEKKAVVQVKDMWIDIGATDEEDAASVVAIGDPVTVQLGLQELRNGLANAPAMDDRTGVWVVFEALRRAAERGVACTLCAASTVQEEIGLRGAQTAAYGFDPHVAIAVDVTHATDCPSVDKRERGAIHLGRGPVVLRGPNINPRVGERLVALAEEGDIPYQVAALGRAAPNDSAVLQTTRAGVATGLVQIPNRYMHSAVETVSLDDLERTAELLTAFACGLTADDSFVP
jgi:tetrahedral aminopeptidase